jgi:hypothetical protein
MIDSGCSDSQLADGRDKEGITFGRESPMRCVSEFDKVAASDEESERTDYLPGDDTDSSSRDVPPLPNPLCNNKVLSAHMQALRIEAELHPLRVVLSRLMAHPTFNRKGLFNHPVDPIALRLPDYHTIVTRPMDLGTVKARLHAIAYDRQDEVVADIRLVFQNAMLYNPAGHQVHASAKSMLEYFEELYATIVRVRAPSKPVVSTSHGVVAAARSMIFPDSRSTLCQSLFEKDNSMLPSCSAPSEILCSSAPVDVPLEGAKAVPQATAFFPGNPEKLNSEVASCLKTNEGGSVTTSIVHSKQSTRSRPPAIVAPQVRPIRRRRSSQVRTLSHSCQACLGRICAICNQGCLPLEPTLLICTGANCAGARIRKGAVYYIAKDGSRQFCQRCYTNLGAVMQHSSNQDSLRYKSDLLKRKNEEEVAERWLTCGKCGTGVHQICAMYNEFVHSDSDMPCPKCYAAGSTSHVKSTAGPENPVAFNDLYTFVSGADLPVPMSSVVDRQFLYGDQILNAESLQETPVSSFIQDRVRSRMKDAGCPNAELTIIVRIISDCEKEFQVPDVVRKHFRMESHNDEDGRPISPPSRMSYHSQAIALFQKVDALDVCIFCMYVQEYDGNDFFETRHELNAVVPQKKRVYIAYLDSVEHFRPRTSRTLVYHEMLVSYLAAARARGYEAAHIWACPPSRGNSFVFWNHPASQRTPTKERLEAWYHGALSRAIECGVVTDVRSLYESDFQRNLSVLRNDGGLNLEKSGRMVCPPLFEGDFWVDEAVRLHSASISRNLKTRLPGEAPCGRGSQADMEGDERCPAVHVAALLRDRLISHPSSVPFRRPVNAAALKLHDYHKIIAQPMDLGTVYSRCVMGEYRLLSDLVTDVHLVFSNARRYNPKGHVVHDRAIELESIFTDELNALMKSWCVMPNEGDSQHDFADISMSLDMRLETRAREEQILESEEKSKVEAQHVPVDDVAMVCSDSQLFTCPETCEAMDVTVTQEGALSTSPRIDASASLGPTDELSPKKLDFTPTLELLCGGPEAIHQRMVGKDVWLLDKKNPVPPKNVVSGKKCAVKRKRSPIDPEEPPKQRRRQAWLGEEVGASVRKMRTSFFACSLVPKASMSDEEKKRMDDYHNYVDSFSSRIKAGCKSSGRVNVSHIADARHALHELSQYRNFEFDTLRRAKYSTAMLLYHLHNDDAPGLVPMCSACNQDISEVRWHKVRKEGERPRVYQAASPRGNGSTAFETDWKPEELCSKCYSKHPKADDFIPLQVSLKASDA